MRFFIGFSDMIDRATRFIAMFGGWLGVMLVIAVCYDVVTRYFGVPKPAGLNSTMIQESEYWLHSFLIACSIGYAYLKDAHVRVDLFRPNFSGRTKLWIELFGLIAAVIPYSLLGLWLSWPYTVKSFLSGEISKSQNGLSDLWILKGGLVVLFVLIFFAGISKFIKIIAALRGDLPMEEVSGEEL
ncbi:TRAP transporter small permease subunit [Enterovibrio norvegicus]|uniref:TRAP transporter small permease subunit n=1 Tax=Enterovibrio norvegicus TaxID=188144 RepID=UPI000C8398EE|nr:TRAP transporter small permease subunit [Enterovibrio norvegicus]PMH66055.1 hypothetical protein BCU62_10585 [Enterovibrio norvegicus]